MTLALGRYQVGDVVGSGRTGRVMRGTRADDSADVAVRQIPPRLLEDRDIRKLLKNLPFRCFGLRSPAIVPVLDAFEISGSVAVVEPWIEGPPLTQGLDAAGAPLTRDVAAVHLVALLEGLLELHDRGGVHGDVRADNILVSESGPRLVGLGVAEGLQRRIKSGQGLGSTGSVEIGDAPELADSPPSSATDLYGLAAAYRVVLRKVGAVSSDPLLEAVERGAQLAPDARWGDAEDFLDAVRPHLESIRAAEAVAEHGGSTRSQRKGSTADETGIDVASGLNFDDIELSQAELSVDGGDSPEPNPVVDPPGGALPQALGLGLADSSLEVDYGPEGHDHEPALKSATREDEVTTAGRYRAVGPVEDTSGVSQYRWLVVSGSFTAVLVLAYLGFVGIRALLPDLPDGMVEVVPATLALGVDVGAPPEVPSFSFSHERLFIDRAEVTGAAYAQCVLTGECTPTTGRLKGPQSAPDKPMAGVTWLQAQSYCNHIGKRLPTENEWEAIARTFGGAYGTGDETPSCATAVFGRGDGAPCSRGGVGSGPRRAMEPSEDGEPAPVDLSGNLWEFVDSDWSDARGEGSGGASPAGGSVLKVIKGGGWFSPVGQLRVSGRLPVQNIYWAADVGFRCAMDPLR